jgi:hypothetical protein
VRCIPAMKSSEGIEYATKQGDCIEQQVDPALELD